MNNLNNESERLIDRLSALVAVVPTISFAAGCLITYLLRR
ncbi:hypothetical protein B0I21_11181 [Sphingobacterium paludis]|uniref:Uncharacterized protein n=1 Tax=Sphingobacterium paludis TaxID=1476465 RepID=A0A4R7CSW6_9SPHI|nr:hypothetical protein B0I21_11181 [Sphingobacterium paludis]